MSDSIQFGDTPTRDWRKVPNPDDDEYSEDGTPAERAFAKAAMRFDPATDPDFAKGADADAKE